MNVTIQFSSLTERKTVYHVLREKLGREPTHAELIADVKRILADGMREMADATVKRNRSSRRKPR